MLRCVIININKLSINTDIKKRSHKMTKLLKQFTQLFATKTTRLEEFLASKAIKTHADVEYWSKYFEYRGF